MKVQKTKIPFSQTNYFSNQIVDYISGAEQLKPFYITDFSIDSFADAIALKSKQKMNRNLLVEVLQEQYNKANCEAPKHNLELLKSDSTFTVTTGHQLCLLTGPLYFIYKIITTINLAEELKQKYPSLNFVPVYWMASEDHDFAEVNHIHLFGKKMEWNNLPETGSIPVGKLPTKSLLPLLDELKTVLGDSENAKFLIDLFNKAYVGSENLALATRLLVNELFSEYGLVIIDADDKTLKTEFSKFLLHDIKERSNGNLVKDSLSKLENLGYKAQVNPREINSFYMRDAYRERLVFEDGKYLVTNTNLVFSEAEIEEELKNFPERFSPNVVLRPLYQEVILPNLAYIGGGGELAYWLEYKTMFDSNSVLFPILVLRNSVLLIDGPSMEKWKKFGFEETNYFDSVEHLVKNFIAQHTDGDLTLAEEKQSLRELFELISIKAQKHDSTLKASTEAELQKALAALTNLENKILKAEKLKQEISLNQVKKIKEKLFPEGQLQERHANFISFYLKFGSDFIPTLKANLKPLEAEFVLLTTE
jgi:bacillithiol biosynthesis cysteine-adding enzyme BshC